MNSLLLSLNVELQYLKEVYNKNIYFPYYNGEYPNNTDEGKTILSASPSRNEFSLSFNTLIKKHSLLLGIQYAKEAYQSLNIY